MSQGLLKTSVALACMAMLVAGCGQKGPLTLVSPEARTTAQPATPTPPASAPR
jgi:predicted small lipoprotein YifL